MSLKAEPFCLTCHTTARVGDVLGEVIVRSYLGTKLLHWWEEARILTVLGVVKILIHTVVLFVLLKIRMEPLLSLRGAVSSLAKGGGRLSERAAVKSSDEFGELAHDLNVFLERISHIAADLSGVLTSVVVSNDQLTTAQAELSNQYERMTRDVREALDRGRDESTDLGALTREWQLTFDALAALLAEVATSGDLPAEPSNRLLTLSEALSRTSTKASSLVQRNEVLSRGLLRQSEGLLDIGHWFTEMATIEHRMQAVSQQGQTLLQRLAGRSVGVADSRGQIP